MPPPRGQSGVTLCTTVHCAVSPRICKGFVSAAEAVQGADAVVIPTERAEFASLDFEERKAAVKQLILFDLRNIYHRNEAESAGSAYCGAGVR